MWTKLLRPPERKEMERVLYKAGSWLTEGNRERTGVPASGPISSIRIVRFSGSETERGKSVGTPDWTTDTEEKSLIAYVGTGAKLQAAWASRSGRTSRPACPVSAVLCFDPACAMQIYSMEQD